MDIYLIHLPAKDIETTSGTWKALEKIYDEGRVRVIGVSNFFRRDFEALKNHANIQPMINQIEFNPYCSQIETRKYCKEHDIAVEAFFPLCGQTVGSKGDRLIPPPEIEIFDNPLLLRIAEKYGKTAAQIALRWETQSDVIVIPKTTKLKRLKENFDIFDIALTDDEMKKINSLNLNYYITTFQPED